MKYIDRSVVVHVSGVEGSGGWCDYAVRHVVWVWSYGRVAFRSN